MTNKALTIIITTFNSEDKIDTCLNAIDSNTKVIIVENSDNLKFKTLIEKKYSNVECMLSGSNIGYGSANNIGLRSVKTKYSLILNPDTILDKEALENFFIFIKKKIDFAILGPAQDKNQKSFVQNDLNLIEANFVKGFAMFLNMEKFIEIGFFDENFFLYLEEVDLCKRLKNINEKIYLDRNIKIFHEGGKSVNTTFFNEVELTRNWHWMWSLFYYNKKHYSYFYAIILIFPNFISALSKSFFYSFFDNNKKKQIYLKRLSGILSSVLGKPSWYRPKLD